MPTEASISEPCLFIISFVILVAGVVLAFAKTPVGPAPGKYLNRVTLLVCVFFSATTFSFGLFVNAETLSWRNFATPLSNALRMMHSSGVVPVLTNGGMPVQLFNALVLYEQLLYLLAPVSTLIAIAQLLQEAGSFARMRRRSVLNDTFVLTPLNSRTLELAKDIRRCYRAGDPKQSRYANVVFAGVKAKGDEPLLDGVREHGFITLEQPLEIVTERLLRTMSFRTTVCVRKLHDAILFKPHRGTSDEEQPLGVGHAFIMLDNDNESSNIARAIALQQHIGELHDGVEVQIFAVAQRPRANAHTSESKPDHAELHYIDWTYNLVQKTLGDYPLFLQSMQPQLLENDGGCDLTSYKRWQRNMLERDDRHVVVVGAGHVGTEFLMQGLSYSRIWGTAFSFDVLDSVADPHDRSACLAKQLIIAKAPELLNEGLLNQEDSMRLSVEFHTCDVTQSEYEKFLEKRATTISYVFVCLGNDTLTTQAALKASEVLERALVRRLADGLNVRQGDAGYAHCNRPLVVGVVDSDELARVLTQATGAHHNQLQFVGSPSNMYTFHSMMATEPRKTDYEQRQTYTSSLHAKYRVFAYAKKLLGAEGDLSGYPIDWRADFLREAERIKQATDDQESATRRAIKQYNAHCQRNNDWLLRMEHNRWCTYTRALGYRHATEQELDAYFNTSTNKNTERESSAYRNADALLHPYLVPFNDVARVDNHVAKLQEYAGQQLVESHLAKCERYLPVGKPNG